MQESRIKFVSSPGHVIEGGLHLANLNESNQNFKLIP